MRIYPQMSFQMKQLAFLCSLILLFSCKSQLDDSIKQGYFDNCKKATVEKLVGNFFENPKWESFMATDDKYHCNVSGRITYDNQPVKATIQFEILEDERWQINAFEINGEPQQDAMIESLVTEMCKAYPN